MKDVGFYHWYEASIKRKGNAITSARHIAVYLSHTQTETEKASTAREVTSVRKPFFSPRKYQEKNTPDAWCMIPAKITNRR